MARKRLKLCLVGCGMIGRVHAQACAKCVEDIELYVCDANPEAAKTMGEEHGAAGIFTDYADVLADRNIDAVDLCLPHHLHAPTALSAFDAGKHVLLEKPITNSLAEADSLIAAARKSGLVFAVSENFRFEPGIWRAVELIQSGFIGKPFLIQIQEMSFTVEINAHMRACDWRRRESTGGGGVLFDRGVHLMAMANQLGGPVKSVYAATRRPAEIWDVDETSVVMFEHANGTITNLIESWNVRSAPQVPMMAIYGTGGSIVEDIAKRMPGHSPFEIGGLIVHSTRREELQSPADPDYLADAKLYMKMVLNAEVPDDVLGRALERGVPIDIVSEFGMYNSYEASIMDFVGCIREGKAPHVPGEHARADIELVFAAYESARTGQPVALPLNH